MKNKTPLAIVIFTLVLILSFPVLSQLTQTATLVRQLWEKIGDDIYNTNIGNVGIGTFTPQTKLEVNGTARIQNNIEVIGGKADIGQGKIEYDMLSNIFNIETDPKLTIPIVFRTSGQERLRIDTNGNVGIGTSSPSTSLEVNGNIKTAGFEMPAGASQGKVLTSDSQGQGTWQDPPSSGGSGVPSGYSILGDDATPPAGYVFTGYNITIAQIPGIPPTSEGWATKAPMPTGRQDLGAATVNNLVYAVGGWNSTGGLGYQDVNEEYNPQANTWNIKSPMPTKRFGAVVVTANNRIYVIGGANNNGILSDNEVYDPQTNSWSIKSPMSTARYAAAAAVVNNKIYVIGGWTGSGYMSTVEEYDVITDTWTSKANMNVQRDYLTAATVNGKLYAIGGRGVSGDLDVNEEYDPISNTWTLKSSMPTPREGLTAAVINNTIFVIGGYNGVYLSKNERYDPVTNSWSSMVDLPTSRYRLASAEVNGKIYVLGGGNQTKLDFQVNEEYIPVGSPGSPNQTIQFFIHKKL